MDMAQLSAMRAQAQPKPVMPLEAAAMRGSVLPRGPRVPQQPTAMQAIGDAFKQPLTSPTGQGLAAAAMAGLEYGGPSMKHLSAKVWRAWALPAWRLMPRQKTLA